MLARKRIIIIAGGVILLFLLVGFWAARGPDRRDAQTVQSQKRREQARLERLYEQASKDIESGKFKEAADKLKKVAAANPRFKDVKTKLEQVERLAVETPPVSPTATATLTLTSPAQTSSSQDTSPGTSASSPETPAGQAPAPPVPPKPKDIPADTTPLSLLPTSLEGYASLHKRWVIEPKEADAGYRPMDVAAKIEIDFVSILVAKFDTKKEADARLAEEQNRFPYSAEDLEINGHSAYFGLYDESRPDLYPPLASLMWTRDKWFFGVTVVPGSFPPTAYKRKIALAVAQLFGY